MKRARQFFPALAGIALTALLSSFAPPARAAEATSESERALSDAYVALVQADQARDAQDWKKAVEGYREALDRYQRLSRKHPNWEPDIVQYRITYCGNQIEAISTRTGRSAQKWIEQAEPAAGEGTYREKYTALLKENQYLHQRLSEIQDEAIEPEAGTGAEGMTDTNAIGRLRQENEQLRADLDAARAETGARTSPDNLALQAAQDELARLRSDLSEAKDEAAELREKGQDAAKLEIQVGDLRRQNESLSTVLKETTQSSGSISDTDLLKLMRASLAQERQGNVSAALAIYERAATTRPSYTAAQNDRARCLLNLGRTEEALKILRTEVTGGLADRETRLLTGLAHCSAGQFTQAVDALKPLVRDEPSNPWAHSALGSAWMGVGDLKSAAGELKRALSLNDALPDAHVNLALVLNATQPADRETARAHYRRALELGAASDPELDRLLATP
jgi:Flp pilus assembly protein TadD